MNVHLNDLLIDARFGIYLKKDGAQQCSFPFTGGQHFSSHRSQIMDNPWPDLSQMGPRGLPYFHTTEDSCLIPARFSFL